MKKYLISTICMLLILMSGLTLYAAEPRVVKVGAFNYYPGIFKDTDGTVKGFYVDALADVAQRENIRFEYVYGSWSEGLERIKSGEVDVITSVAFTPERAEFLDYPKTPLLTVWGELYVPQSSDIDGIRAVQGKRIAVMKNDFNARHFIDLVKKFDISCEFIEMPGFEDVFKAVAAKKVDAGVVNNTFGVAKQKEFGLRSTGVVFNPFDIFFAVAKGKNSGLLVMLDTYLKDWRHQADSTYNKARQKWSHGSDNVIHVIPRWLLSTFVMIAFLTLCAFAFIFMLKKQVISKTRSAVEAAEQYRRVAHELTLSEERFRLIMETVAVIPWEFNIPENRWTYVGPQVTGLMGYAPEEWTTLEWWLEIIHPEDRTWVPAYCAEQTSRGEEHSMEYRLQAKDGSFLWVDDLVTIEMLDGKPYIMRGIIVDITERKKAEEALYKLNKQLSLLNDVVHGSLEAADVGAWWIDFAEEDTFRALDITANLIGIPINQSDDAYKISAWVEVLQKTKTLDPDYARRIDDTLEQFSGTISGKYQAYRAIYPVALPDGTIRWIDARANVSQRDAAGTALFMIGTLIDITERKKIEEVQSYLLQISSFSKGEDFFESLARYLANILGMDYVCIDTLHGDCLSARTLAIYNDGRFEDNVEYTLKDTPCGDVVGKEVCVFPRGVGGLFPQDEALQVLQAESYVGTTLWSFDVKPIGLIAVIGRKELLNSNFAETVLKLVAVKAAGELERRQADEHKHLLEQQFQHTQKLESLGVLAGGIAHDFNNILAVIMGYCSLTKRNYEHAENHILEIEKAAERAAALCRQMLAYAGKASLTQGPVNAWMLVDEMVAMLKTTIQQNVVIKLELGTDIPFVMGDASQLRQVVMNLIINAAEAIGDAEGEIQVSLAKTEIKSEQPDEDHHGFIIPVGRYICFEVSDNGCGMDDDTRRKIFEPFYTTKFTGRGLGMSAVLGIVKAHNGALQLESRLEHGTTFRVYLPVPLSKSETEEAQQTTASAAWQGSGIILLAEDEVQVKSIAIDLLQNLGFKVLDAANGKEALELYQQNAADITLVVTDMGMPVMNGYELFYKLKQLNPQLPIIVTSGFGEGDIFSKIPSEEIAGLINKPYSFDQLRDVLMNVVEVTKTTHA